MQKEAKEKIKKLIDRYEELSDAERKHYNEQQTKEHFIRPLFEALGWDFENDVWPEISVSKKRGDYAFKVGGITKFFVEAKPLSVNLDELRWAEQAIWYAWHKGVSWAILTDFKSIKVFNAEWDEQDPERNLVLDIKYQDYLENEKFLWLSKESMENGDMDKHAEENLKRPKRAAVDKQLVADLLRWRDRLFNDFKGYNLLVNEQKISENVQRFLNRIIFIRTCEDREFENRILQEVVRNWEEGGYKNNDLVNRLRKVFIGFDKDYDSKLFEEKIIFDNEKFIVDDNTLASIIKETYKSPKGIRWNFDDIKDDIMGSIYEQYLGFVQKREKSGERADESKRKSQGIYYTPEYIVDFIVKNTLSGVLKTKSAAEIKNIKILDPACGSGSFLIRVYRELIEYWQNQKNKKTHFEKGTHLGKIEKTIKQNEGIKIMSSQEKMDILRNNIYGVDLDEKAVEIAQLNLLLKTVDRKMKLPNLQHILCGNSLISVNESELKKYFGRSWQSRKPFDWEKRFPEVIKQGFDMVIGNPPYIDSEEMTRNDKRFRLYCADKYESARGNWDIFCVFIQRGLDLLKEGGYFGMIIPNKLLSADYAQSIRQIIKKYLIVSISDYSNIKVFGASVYPIVIVIRKIIPETNHSLSVNIFEKKNGNVGLARTVKIKQNELDKHEKSWSPVLGYAGEADFINRIIKNAEPLRERCNVHGAATVSEAYEIKKIIKNLTDENNCFKFVNTGTIDRYVSLWENGKTQYIKKSYLKPIIKKEELLKIFPKRYEEASKSKIIVAGMTKNIECYFDETGEYLAGKSTTIIESTGVDLKFVVALLNSRLMTFLYKNIFKSLSLQGGYLRIGAPQIKELPIIIPSDGVVRSFLKNVEKIIKLNKECQQIDPLWDDEKYKKVKEEIEKIDKKIDEEVYKLYGLAPAEIKIVEGGK